jgi:hypothetical protein
MLLLQPCHGHQWWRSSGPLQSGASRRVRYDVQLLWQLQVGVFHSAAETMRHHYNSKSISAASCWANCNTLGQSSNDTNS